MASDLRLERELGKMFESRAVITIPNVAALTGVAQWIEHQPGKQRVAGSIPSQVTCLGCRPGPGKGALERQPHIDISLPLFLPPFPSVER